MCGSFEVTVLLGLSLIKVNRTYTFSYASVYGLLLVTVQSEPCCTGIVCTLDRGFMRVRRVLISLYLSFDSTMKSSLLPAATPIPYSGHFFLLSVAVACYTPSRKKKKNRKEENREDSSFFGANSYRTR